MEEREKASGKKEDQDTKQHTRAKGRRVTEKALIAELGSLLPISTEGKKDKLSILRLVTTYIRLRRAIHTGSIDIDDLASFVHSDGTDNDVDTSPDISIPDPSCLEDPNQIPTALLDNDGNLIAGTLSGNKPSNKWTDIALSEEVVKGLQRQFSSQDKSDIEEDEQLNKYKQGLERGMRELLGQTLLDCTPSINSMSEFMSADSHSPRGISETVIPKTTGFNTKGQGQNIISKTSNVSTIKDRNMKPICKIEEESRLLLEAAQGFLLLLDPKLRVNFISENVTPYLGHEQFNMLGKNIKDFVHPKDMKDLEQMMKSVSETGSTKRMMYVGMNYCFHTPGCRIRDEGFTLVQWNLHIRRERDEKTSGVYPSGVVCLCRPVRTGSMLEIRVGGSMFMARHDMSYTFLSCDARVSNLLGYEASDLIGQKGYYFKNPIDCRHCQYSHKRLLEVGKVESGYYRFLGKAGMWVWMFTQLTLVRDTNGKPLYIVCKNFVVSQEEAKRELAREKRDLALVMVDHVSVPDINVNQREITRPIKRKRPDSFYMKFAEDNDFINTPAKIFDWEVPKYCPPTNSKSNEKSFEKYFKSSEIETGVPEKLKKQNVSETSSLHCEFQVNKTHNLPRPGPKSNTNSALLKMKLDTLKIAKTSTRYLGKTDASQEKYNRQSSKENSLDSKKNISSQFSKNNETAPMIQNRYKVLSKQLSQPPQSIKLRGSSTKNNGNNKQGYSDDSIDSFINKHFNYESSAQQLYHASREQKVDTQGRQSFDTYLQNAEGSISTNYIQNYDSTYQKNESSSSFDFSSMESERSQMLNLEEFFDAIESNDESFSSFIDDFLSNISPDSVQPFVNQDDLIDFSNSTLTSGHSMGEKETDTESNFSLESMNFPELNMNLNSTADQLNSSKISTEIPLNTVLKETNKTELCDNEMQSGKDFQFSNFNAHSLSGDKLQNLDFSENKTIIQTDSFNKDTLLIETQHTNTPQKNRTNSPFYLNNSTQLSIHGLIDHSFQTNINSDFPSNNLLNQYFESKNSETMTPQKDISSFLCSVDGNGESFFTNQDYNSSGMENSFEQFSDELLLSEISGSTVSTGTNTPHLNFLNVQSSNRLDTELQVFDNENPLTLKFDETIDNPNL